MFKYETTVTTRLSSLTDLICIPQVRVLRRHAVTRVIASYAQPCKRDQIVSRMVLSTISETSLHLLSCECHECAYGRGIIRTNPVVRANCALTETGKPSVVLNKRYGEKEEFEPLTAESTEKLLEEAYTQAREKAGIVWNGQEFLVQGNPAVFDNASAEE